MTDREWTGSGPTAAADVWRRHTVYMYQALELAQKAYQSDEVPVGAIVVFDNRIVGRGYNQVEMLGDPTAHAEMIAISSACDTLGSKVLNDCTLYVTLEPCVMCTGASVWSRISRIVFGASDEKSGACGSRFQLASDQGLNHQAECIQGILEEECSQLLKRFFQDKR